MSERREDLLQPSLTDDAPPAAAPYSVQTTFLTGFFGGPFAAIAIFAVNSFRLRRVPRDVPAWLVMLACILMGWWAVGNTALGAAGVEWLREQFGPSGARFGYRIVALLIVGAGYFLHRTEQRAATLAGLTRPNGLVAGLLCIGAGIALLTILATAR
jgi:hypothetical protein